MTYAPILRWDNDVLKPVLVETSEGLKIAFDEELCDCECGEKETTCDCPTAETLSVTLEGKDVNGIWQNVQTFEIHKTNGTTWEGILDRFGTEYAVKLVCDPDQEYEWGGELPCPYVAFVDDVAHDEVIVCTCVDPQGVFFNVANSTEPWFEPSGVYSAWRLSFVN